MRGGRRVLAAMGLLGTGLAVLFPTPAHAADVTGTVRDGASAAVVGASVTAVVDGTAVGTTMTNGTGAYTFASAPAGTYKVFVAPPAGALGFAIADATVGAGGATIDVTLPAATTVTGTVNGPAGTGLAGVTVAFGAPPNAPVPETTAATCPPAGQGPTATTDGSGNYTLTNVGGVSCPLWFSKTDHASSLTGDTAEPALATSVTVAAGGPTVVAPTTSLPFAGSIAGTIRDTGNLPASPIGVYLSFADGSPVSTAGPSAETASDGTFTIGGLRPGTYGLTHFGGGYSALRTPLSVVVPFSPTANPAPVVAVVPAVVPLPPVTITALAPTAMAVGTTANLTIVGTGFQPGATLDGYVPEGGSVTFGAATVVSSTVITSTLTLTSAVPTGHVIVSVLNPDDAVATCTNCIAVTGATGVAQTVAFANAPPASVGAGSTFPVVAYATGGGDVALTTTGACTGSGTNTATITTTAVGACVVHANQAGNATFAAAAEAAATTTVTTDAPTNGGGNGLVTTRPQRLLDTRPDSRAGYTGDKPTAGQTVTLQVTGRAGVPADATAVALNVTGTEATAEGFVTVWPCGEDRPLASSLNLTPGLTSPNAVITKLGTGGTVCLSTQSGTHLLADLTGYFPAGSAYAPLRPDRLLDTRAGSQKGYTGDKPTPGQTVTLQVTGVGTVPVPANAAAVVLNVTGTEATADGFVTVWPCGEDRPLASSLNLTPGVTSPNAVITKLGTGGTVCLSTQSGTHLVADVVGYFPAGASYTSLRPDRLLDTRAGSQQGYTGDKPTAGQTVTLQVSGVGTVPVPAGATTVVLNVTGTEASAEGFVTVWPCGEDRPLASSLNLAPGATSPNAVITKLGTAGTVCLYTQSGTHLVADVVGYVAAAS